MLSKSQLLNAFFLLAVVLVLLLIGMQFGWDFAAITDSVRQYPVLGPFLYVLALFASIVLLPLSSLILLPLAAEVWGIALGGTLSALGWWLGCLLAFLLARHIGRPVLQWFIPLEKLDEWEKRIPKDVTFLGVVLIRMVFPVDIPSFVLGLLKHLSFRTYAIASLIGIVPFAYFMVAMGGAVATGQWLQFVLLLGIVAVSIFVLQRLWKRHAARNAENM